MKAVFLILIVLTFGGYRPLHSLPGNPALDPAEDSAEYIRQTLAFLQQVEAKYFGDSLSFLEDKPATPDFLDCFNEIFADTVQFCARERDLIRAKAKNAWIRQWTNTILPDIRIIPGDSVTSIFKDLSRNWIYFHQHFGNGILGFSTPVFYNHYTFCLFYFQYSCDGLCGEGYYKLYKKEGIQWVKLKTYCRWIS